MKSPEEAGTYLMMVCMPRTCGVFSRTLNVFGRGCPWWAEARVALQQESSDQSCATHAHRAAMQESSSQTPSHTAWTPERAWSLCPDPTESPMSSARYTIPNQHHRVKMRKKPPPATKPAACLLPYKQASASTQAVGEAALQEQDLARFPKDRAVTSMK